MMNGERLPASYANFYIANGVVLVPDLQRSQRSRRARDARRADAAAPVVGIHAVDLVWGLGTLHCLTQQEPLGGSGQEGPEHHAPKRGVMVYTAGVVQGWSPPAFE